MFKPPDNIVAFYQQSDASVSTGITCNPLQPFQTVVRHPFYNQGNAILVECYSGIEPARAGHERWVVLMTADKLPSQLLDISIALNKKQVRMEPV